MSDTPNLDRLRTAVRGLAQLLEDPEPGLLHWQNAVRELCGIVAEFAPPAANKAEPPATNFAQARERMMRHRMTEDLTSDGPKVLDPEDRRLLTRIIVDDTFNAPKRLGLPPLLCGAILAREQLTDDDLVMARGAAQRLRAAQKGQP